MLVLSRKNNETISIGDEIEVTVCEIRDGRVRIGISCPKEIPILRKELTDRKGISPHLALVET